MGTKYLADGLILFVAAGLVFSELLWRGDGYRLWLGIGLVVAWVISRKGGVFTTT
jgi:hypothetical protein